MKVINKPKQTTDKKVEKTNKEIKTEIKKTLETNTKTMNMQAKPICTSTRFVDRLLFLFSGKSLKLKITFFNPLTNKEETVNQYFKFGNEEELNKKKYD